VPDTDTDTAGDPPTVWIAPGAAGAILGYTPRWVAQLADDGKLTSRRTPGGHRRISLASVQSLAEETGGAT